MNSAIEHLRAFLVPGKHAHLVGIGGVSMRPLGLVLQGMGIVITGSDMNASVSTQELTEAGITVYIGHRAENILGADCIIRTAAAHNDNPEIQAARAAGIPVFERAEAWGLIMQSYKNAICIAGTHGKTTTTCMMTHVAIEAALDPTVMIGGTLPLLHAGHRVGSGETIILESCEYCNSFLNFSPTVAVINNVEEDHLDFFRDLEDIKASFRKFAELVPPGGLIVASGDDRNTQDALAGLPVVTFGFGEDCDFRAVNCSPDFREFDVLQGGAYLLHLCLGVLGRHNALNALAVTAVSTRMGIAPEPIARGLAAFSGAGRRMEYKGSFRGALLYDDYSHHPSELHALFEAAKMMGCRRIICAFQPHTYTRTAALFDDFIRELRLADVAVLTEIYAAREKNTVGISSQDLVAAIPGAIYCPTLPSVTECLRSLAQPGDLILTVGAGDIYKAGEALLKTQ